METTLTGTPRISIRGNWDIAVIETHIKDYLCHCEMWGDLNISLEEYDCIKEKIAGALGSNPSAKEVKAIFRKYPIVMVTDIISFVLFDYDNNEFWSGWASRFNIDIAMNNQTEIGRMVREIFEKFEFKVIEDGGYVYVTPILCQAGIPSSCFDKLFDILDSTLNSSYFMAREIVSELMSYRSYLIDAPVERYFRLHTERAIELIVQLRQMMHAVGDLSVSRELTELPEVHSFEQRRVKRYAQWSAETKKLGKKSRKNTQYYFSPKLVYDDTKGICLFIPEQTLRQDSIYKLRWIIIGDGDAGNAKTVYSQVYADQDRNYTREANIPVDIANTYTIQLRDDDDDSVQLTNSWVVNGLGNSIDILTFNESGSLLPPTQRYIARKGTIVVFDSRRASITEINSINKVDVNLPYSWADLQAFCAYPTDKDARLTIQTLSEVICIESKKSFDIDLVQVGTLFDEKYKGNETPVYTRFPTVELNGNIGNYNPALLSYWSVVIIHRLSNTKHTAMLSELGFKVYGDCVRFSLGDYAQEYFEGMYGAYDLRIYDGKTRKYFVFYLSPKIDYVANVEDIQSDRSFGHRRAVFYLQKNDAVENPTEIISGKIKSPYIELNNDKIASRHVNSIVLAWFFRRNEICKAYFKGDVRSLVGNDGRETILVALKNELDQRPEDLIESIERVLPPQLMSRLEIKKWTFVDKLIGVDGSLTNAIEEKQRDLETLGENLKKRHEKKQNNSDLIRLINTLEKQQTINFLASSGVIPKYGFPVDVVKLDIRSNAAEAKEVDLSRDLKLAISEYAPGSEIIAAGKVWTSYSINKIRDKEWPTYQYFECPDCRRTSFPEGITTIEEIDDEELHLCDCGEQMKPHKVIIPIFGFSTSWLEKAKKVGEIRPKRFYPTRVQFGGFDALDQYQEAEKQEAEIQIADKSIDAKYSPQGKLVIMNKGTNGAGLFICKYCGYAKTNPQDFKHKNKMGIDCPNKYATNAALGHIFASDILWLEFPSRYVEPVEGKDQWTTLLYAILEGAADALGISRDDINGCIDRSGNHPIVILFDEAPGGAGHVKRIYSQLDAVLKAA